MPGLGEAQKIVPEHKAMERHAREAHALHGKRMRDVGAPGWPRAAELGSRFQHRARVRPALALPVHAHRRRHHCYPVGALSNALCCTYTLTNWTSSASAQRSYSQLHARRRRQHRPFSGGLLFPEAEVLFYEKHETRSLACLTVL